MNKLQHATYRMKVILISLVSRTNASQLRNDATMIKI